MDIDRLRAVMVIAEAGSLRQAATRLHLSQSALSQLLKQVEQDLGVQLFQRRHAGLTLRPEAEAVLIEIGRLLEQADRITTAAGDLASGATGRIHLRTVESASESILPALLERWSQEQPGSPLSVATATPAMQLRQLIAGDCDAGLLRLPLTVPGIATATVFCEPLVLIRHRAADAPGPGLAAAAVADSCMIRFPVVHGPGLVDVTRHLLDQLDAAPRRVIEVDDMTTLLALVAAGQGWALVPASLRYRHPCRLQASLLAPPLRQLAQVELALAWQKHRPPAALPHLLETLCQLGQEIGREMLLELDHDDPA